MQIHRLTCLWYRSHRDRALTMLLVHDPSSNEPYELALISTDLDASSVELVERFACRWRSRSPSRTPSNSSASAKRATAPS